MRRIVVAFALALALLTACDAGADVGYDYVTVHYYPADHHCEIESLGQGWHKIECPWPTKEYRP